MPLISPNLSRQPWLAPLRRPGAGGAPLCHDSLPPEQTGRCVPNVLHFRWEFNFLLLLTLHKKYRKIQIKECTNFLQLLTIKKNKECTEPTNFLQLLTLKKTINKGSYWALRARIHHCGHIDAAFWALSSLSIQAVFLPFFSPPLQAPLASRRWFPTPISPTAAVCRLRQS